MANEIDILMDLDPLELAKIEGGVDAIVQIMRQRRAQAELGIKVKKETGPKAKLDLDILGIAKKPAAPAITRR